MKSNLKVTKRLQNMCRNGLGGIGGHLLRRLPAATGAPPTGSQKPRRTQKTSVTQCMKTSHEDKESSCIIQRPRRLCHYSDLGTEEQRGAELQFLQSPAEEKLKAAIRHCEAAVA